MIYDSINNIDFYSNNHKNLNKAIAFLKRDDLSTLNPGKHTIFGEQVFALVLEYDTHPLFEDKWEAHRKYYDLQFMLSGTEKIALSDIKDMKVTQSYNSVDDYELFSGTGDLLTLKQNDFILLKPHEVHQPGIILKDKPEPIRKIVVKALI